MFRLVILSNQQHIDLAELFVDSEEMGLAKDIPISVQQTCLLGGKQAGSRMISLTVGDTVVRVIPTRGMAVLEVLKNGTRFGWESPVKEVVHPSFVNQEATDGLGWLDGFNEMLARCGYQWAGHPGQDGDEFLTLHGRIQNTPADEVILEVEQVPPYRVTLRGRVDEKRFKSTNFELQAVLSLALGEDYLTIEDILTNKGSYAREYQAIYHNNFAQPILEDGAQLHVPMVELSPFNEYAIGGLAHWNQMPAPSKDFDEMVFNIRPISDEKGLSYALLHNASGECGIEVAYQTDTLPVLTIWKNTDTEEQGYVVGIEPGTSFAYNRHYQRDLGLVPTIEAGQAKHFYVRFGLLTQAVQVSESRARIDKLQTTQQAKVLAKPLVLPFAESLHE